MPLGLPSTEGQPTFQEEYEVEEVEDREEIPAHR